MWRYIYSVILERSGVCVHVCVNECIGVHEYICVSACACLLLSQKK